MIAKFRTRPQSRQAQSWFTYEVMKTTSPREARIAVTHAWRFLPPRLANRRPEHRAIEGVVWRVVQSGLALIIRDIGQIAFIGILCAAGIVALPSILYETLIHLSLPALACVQYHNRKSSHSSMRRAAFRDVRSDCLCINRFFLSYLNRKTFLTRPTRTGTSSTHDFLTPCYTGLCKCSLSFARILSVLGFAVMLRHSLPLRIIKKYHCESSFTLFIEGVEGLLALRFLRQSVTPAL